MLVTMPQALQYTFVYTKKQVNLLLRLDINGQDVPTGDPRDHVHASSAPGWQRSYRLNPPTS